MNKSISERVYQIVIRTFILLLSITCLFPLIYVLGLSFTNEQEWVQTGGMLLWPSHPTLNAYISVITKTPIFFNSLGVSAMRVVIGTLIILTFTFVMGYVLSKQDLPGRKFLLIFVLITTLFSGGLIPTYLVVKNLKLIDNFWVFIIPGMVDSWGVLVFKQFFENIPQSVIESAEIDGASEVVLMTRIVLPMSTAVIAAWGLFVSVGQWNSWFDALVYIRSDNLKPLQLVMYTLFQNNLGYDMNLGVTNPVNRVSLVSVRMAITALGTLPILCIYPFLQKYFTTGVYIGSIKG